MLVHAAGTPSIGFERAGRTTTFLIGPHPYGELGCSRCRAAEPQAFLVEVGPSETIRTHYHQVDQFQLFLGGRGRVGREPLEPGFIHYADRLTPYGPLVSDATGMSYMTIRRRSDPGAGWMPDTQAALGEALSTSERSARARRHHTVDAFGVLAGQPDAEWAVPVADDAGLRIAAVRGRANEAVTLLPRGGAGGYLAVVRGAVHVPSPEGSMALEHGSILFTDGGDAVTSVVAGPDGAVLVDLQFPAEDPTSAAR